MDVNNLLMAGQFTLKFCDEISEVCVTCFRETKAKKRELRETYPYYIARKSE